MKKIKVAVTDFEYGSEPQNNFLIQMLQNKYDVEISDAPDFLFYSVWGCEHKKYDCVKIFYTGEPASPDFNECDYAIGFDDISFDDRYMRIPLFAMQMTRDIQNREKFKDIPLGQKKFCNFVYNNETVGRGAIARKEFCRKLMKYKAVDCPGSVLHNMESEILSSRFHGLWYQSKIEFIKDYKFTIAFENSFINGYTTEKLLQPFMAGSIPIYFGNAKVAMDFNTGAFINAADYGNDFDAVIERVMEIDADDQKARDMILCQPMVDDHWFGWKEKLESFLEHIIEKGTVSFEKFKTENVQEQMEVYGTDNARIYGTAVLEEIGRYEKVYIYGDGLFGRRMAAILKKKNAYFHINGFVVTDEKRVGESLMGKSVFPLKSVNSDKNVLFLIAIREEAQQKLVTELRRKGWTNLISVNEVLLNAMETAALNFS